MNFPMHHPQNPKTHEWAVGKNLASAVKYTDHRFRVYMELACESAEEVAVLTGLDFSTLPGSRRRNKHNDIFRELVA